MLYPLMLDVTITEQQACTHLSTPNKIQKEYRFTWTLPPTIPNSTTVNGKKVSHVCLVDSCQCIMIFRRKILKGLQLLSVREDWTGVTVTQHKEPNLHITSTLPTNKLAPFSSLFLSSLCVLQYCRPIYVCNTELT